MPATSTFTLGIIIFTRIWKGIVLHFKAKWMTFLYPSHHDAVDQINPKSTANLCFLFRYFFGEGYIYGNQLKQRGPGNERLFPKIGFDRKENLWLVCKVAVVSKLVKLETSYTVILPQQWVFSVLAMNFGKKNWSRRVLTTIRCHLFQFFL